MMHTCTACKGTGQTKWEPEPSLVTDLLVFSNPADPHVLTVVRRDKPYAGYRAFPGGYTVAGQTVAGSAFRELREETGLALFNPINLVGIYDAPDRDPRGHVVSLAYWTTHPTMPPVHGGDDAKSAEWVPVRPLRLGHVPMAFDHADILDDAFRAWMRAR